MRPLQTVVTSCVWVAVFSVTAVSTMSGKEIRSRCREIHESLFSMNSSPETTDEALQKFVDEMVAYDKPNYISSPEGGTNPDATLENFSRDELFEYLTIRNKFRNHDVNFDDGIDSTQYGWIGGDIRAVGNSCEFKTNNILQFLIGAPGDQENGNCQVMMEKFIVIVLDDQGKVTKWMEFYDENYLPMKYNTKCLGREPTVDMITVEDEANKVRAICRKIVEAAFPPGRFATWDDENEFVDFVGDQDNVLSFGGVLEWRNLDRDGLRDWIEKYSNPSVMNYTGFIKNEPFVAGKLCSLEKLFIELAGGGDCVQQIVSLIVLEINDKGKWVRWLEYYDSDEDAASDMACLEVQAQLGHTVSSEQPLVYNAKDGSHKWSTALTWFALGALLAGATVWRTMNRRNTGQYQTISC